MAIVAKKLNIKNTSGVVQTISLYNSLTDVGSRYIPLYVDGVNVYASSDEVTNPLSTSLRYTTEFGGLPIINGVLSSNSTAMVSITGGTYTQTDGTNSFSHTISSFQLSKYEVTYELWYLVYQWAIANSYFFQNAGREGNDGTNGAAPTTAKLEPVTNISWRDIIVWCNAYSQLRLQVSPYTYSSVIIKDSRDTNATACDNAVCDWSSSGYRLPTEGEWQYAASNKGVTPWNYASGATADYTNATATGLVAWYSANSGSVTKSIGTKTANALGIYDMSGNVAEWCWDRYGAYPVSPQTNYRGLSGASLPIVMKGGCFSNAAIVTIVGSRGSLPTNYIEIFYGFRLAHL
jgi:formylglycine-generating enzyme required for sulfatase activity